MNKLNILITGAKGFIGKNLCEWIKLNTKFEVFEFHRDTNIFEIEKIISKIDIIFHFAGVNKATNKSEFYLSNVNLTKKICELASKNKKIKLYYASSTQVNLNNEYGKSKKEAEKICLNLEKKFSNKVFILRLPGVFGKGCKPNYNSVIATFCHNIAHDKEIRVFDKNKELELVYIDDLCDQLLKSIKENYHGKTFYEIKDIHHISLMRLAQIIKGFKNLSEKNINNSLQDPLVRKLFNTYIKYK